MSKNGITENQEELEHPELSFYDKRDFTEEYSTVDEVVQRFNKVDPDAELKTFLEMYVMCRDELISTILDIGLYLAINESNILRYAQFQLKKESDQYLNFVLGNLDNTSSNEHVINNLYTLVSMIINQLVDKTEEFLEMGDDIEPMNTYEKKVLVALIASKKLIPIIRKYPFADQIVSSSLTSVISTLISEMEGKKASNADALEHIIANPEAEDAINDCLPYTSVELEEINAEIKKQLQLVRVVFEAEHLEVPNNVHGWHRSVHLAKNGFLPVTLKRSMVRRNVENINYIDEPKTPEPSNKN